MIFWFNKLRVYFPSICNVPKAVPTPNSQPESIKTRTAAIAKTLKKDQKLGAKMKKFERRFMCPYLDRIGFRNLSFA